MFVTVAESSVAAPVVSKVAALTFPSTATSVAVNVMRSSLALTPIFASVMRTDSTSTYFPVAPAMDTYPFVLEIASDPPTLPECFSTAASSVMSSSPDVVRLLTVVAPAPSAFVTVAESSVAALVVSNVVVCTLPSTVATPDVSVMRLSSPEMPIFVSVMRTDSTSTYLPLPPAMDTYPAVLEIASDVPELAECVSTAASSVISRSPDVVRLLTVVAPAPSAFVTVAESSVAAPLVVRVVTVVAPAPSAFVTVAESSVAAPVVSNVVVCTLPSTVATPDVSVMRLASPSMPIASPVMRTDSTSTYLPLAPAMDTYPAVLEIASDVPEVAECVSTAAFSVISRSPDVVRLLTVVAPAPSAFVTVAESSVAAPVVSNVVVCTCRQQ